MIKLRQSEGCLIESLLDCPLPIERTHCSCCACTAELGYGNGRNDAPFLQSCNRTAKAGRPPATGDFRKQVSC